MNEDPKTVAELLDEGGVVLPGNPTAPDAVDVNGDGTRNKTPTEQRARLYQREESRIQPDDEDG